jgi:hypothetical protein
MLEEVPISSLGDPLIKLFLEMDAAETRTMCTGRNKEMDSGLRAPGVMISMI